MCCGTAYYGPNGLVLLDSRQYKSCTDSPNSGSTSLYASPQCTPSVQSASSNIGMDESDEIIEPSTSVLQPPTQRTPVLRPRPRMAPLLNIEQIIEEELRAFGEEEEEEEEEDDDEEEENDTEDEEEKAAIKDDKNILVHGSKSILDQADAGEDVGENDNGHDEEEEDEGFFDRNSTSPDSTVQYTSAVQFTGSNTSLEKDAVHEMSAVDDGTVGKACCSTEGTAVLPLRYRKHRMIQ